MTNLQIESKFNNLVRLKERNTTQFPARIAYAIAHNIHILSPLAHEIEDLQDQYLRQYGKPASDRIGYYLIETDEDREKYESNMNELMNIDVPVTLLKIKYQDLENLSLTIEDMDALYFMIEEDKPES